MTNKAVEYLDFCANQFEHRDWNYTRDSHITQIRYTKEHDPANKISSRIKQAFSWLFAPPNFFKMLHPNRFDRFKWRFRMSAYSLKRESNVPDGVLDSGGVITFWEETGEYLEMVQPSVGALLANFLKEEPGHKHALLITHELERIYNTIITPQRKREEDDTQSDN